MQIAISLYGFGNVGREFVRLVDRKMPYLKSRHGIEPRVFSIVTRRGGIRAESGIDWPVLVNLANAGTLSEQEGFVGGDPEDLDRWLLPEESGYVRVLVDATWSDLVTGEPGLSRLKEAARRGFHLVTLNKAPLVA
ncbi:MAG: homoserine dehydrogenase, partial [Firmicutes bacterium]|nr:homoserine dehydrogenase [Bacillota bacterium]